MCKGHLWILTAEMHPIDGTPSMARREQPLTDHSLQAYCLPCFVCEANCTLTTARTSSADSILELGPQVRRQVKHCLCEAIDTVSRDYTTPRLLRDRVGC